MASSSPPCLEVRCLGCATSYCTSLYGEAGSSLALVYNGKPVVLVNAPHGSVRNCTAQFSDLPAVLLLTACRVSSMADLQSYILLMSSRGRKVKIYGPHDVLDRAMGILDEVIVDDVKTHVEFLQVEVNIPTLLAENFYLIAQRAEPLFEGCTQSSYNMVIFDHTQLPILGYLEGPIDKNNNPGSVVSGETIFQLASVMSGCPTIVINLWKDISVKNVIDGLLYAATPGLRFASKIFAINYIPNQQYHQAVAPLTLLRTGSAFFVPMGGVLPSRQQMGQNEFSAPTPSTGADVRVSLAPMPASYTDANIGASGVPVEDNIPPGDVLSARKPPQGGGLLSPYTPPSKGEDQQQRGDGGAAISSSNSNVHNHQQQQRGAGVSGLFSPSEPKWLSRSSTDRRAPYTADVTDARARPHFNADNTVQQQQKQTEESYESFPPPSSNTPSYRPHTSNDGPSQGRVMGDQNAVHVPVSQPRNGAWLQATTAVGTGTTDGGQPQDQRWQGQSPRTPPQKRGGGGGERDNNRRTASAPRLRPGVAPGNTASNQAEEAPQYNGGDYDRGIQRGGHVDPSYYGQQQQQQQQVRHTRAFGAGPGGGTTGSSVGAGTPQHHYNNNIMMTMSGNRSTGKRTTASTGGMFMGPTGTTTSNKGGFSSYGNSGGGGGRRLAGGSGKFAKGYTPKGSLFSKRVEPPKKLYVYNNEEKSADASIVMLPTSLTFPALKAKISASFGLRPMGNLYTVDSGLVTSVEELFHGQEVVATKHAGAPFDLHSLPLCMQFTQPAVAREEVIPFC